MTDNTVIDFEQWKEWASSAECSVKDTIDFRLTEKLSKYFTGFMTGPVALYEGKAIVARTIAIYVLDERVDHDLERLASQDQLFLYTVEYHPVTLVESIFDFMKTSYKTRAYWSLRYALLNDDTLN